MKLTTSVRTCLTTFLLRLAVELEKECCVSVDTGGDIFDAPLQWIEQNGFPFLLASNDELGCFNPRSIEDLAPDELDLLFVAADVVRRASFVADEIQHLSGEAALDFIAGWIGGYCNRSGNDFSHYISHILGRIPLYRESFKAGFENGYSEGLNQRTQAKLRKDEEML